MAKLFTFEIGGGMYGIDVMRVKEVARTLPLTRVHHADERVCGIITVRGDVYTVLDPSISVGVKGVPKVSSDNYVLLKRSADIKGPSARLFAGEFTSNEPVALRVDRIGDIMEIDLSAIEEMPGNGDDPDRMTILGKTRDGLTILNLSAVIAIK